MNFQSFVVRIIVLNKKKKRKKYHVAGNLQFVLSVDSKAPQKQKVYEVEPVTKYIKVSNQMTKRKDCSWQDDSVSDPAPLERGFLSFI